jgi:hypothetical protein
VIGGITGCASRLGAAGRLRIWRRIIAGPAQSQQVWGGYISKWQAVRDIS